MLQTSVTASALENRSVGERRFRDAMPASDPPPPPGLALPQHPDDLLFREPCSVQKAGLQIPLAEKVQGRSQQRAIGLRGFGAEKA